MAPARSSGTATRRVDQDHHHQEQQGDNGDDEDLEEIFVDVMLGSPMQIYIEKDVEDKENIAELVKASRVAVVAYFKMIILIVIQKHGGIVVPGYSGVPYILVDPYKPSGQNLWRQYSNKKGKIILNAEWVKKCVEAGALLTYQDGWGGCKVTGKEEVTSNPRQQQDQALDQHPLFPNPSALMGPSMPPPIPMQIQHILPPLPPLPMLSPITIHSIMQHAAQQVQAPAEPPPPPQPDPVPSNAPYPFPVFAASHPDDSPWPGSSSIVPSQTHLSLPPPPNPSTIQEQAQARGQPEASTSTEPEHPTSMAPHLFHHRPPETAWDGFDPTVPQDPLGYEYRADTATWDPYYVAFYGPSYLDDPQIDGHHTTGPGVPPVAHLPPAPLPPAPILGPGPVPQQVPRGRKKARNAIKSTTPTAHLVPSKGPPARSPSPPVRVLKSTYGGNLFTAEDVMYLKKYIDYCQDQGMVLSLREICERIAIKAPHHTFYSWRRYCNKHQIRLGGYQMATEPEPEREGSPMEDDDPIIEEDPIAASSIFGTLNLPSNIVPSLPIGTIMQQVLPMAPRMRSPTPPRALFRSTTGKGVAFTNEDVAFLIKFMEHRKNQGRLDMVQFWKEVAHKAPHHSRASWMKYWRRHKHEFEQGLTQQPLPQPPEKKMRYSRQDDVLLAKYFYSKPEGTLDSVFQAFGRLYPHHPWKGWQEHHRIHKVKIDHLVDLLNAGLNIDEEGPDG